MEAMISVVVPAKNEELNIGDILTKAKPYADELAIVDGHSIDRTCEIAQELGARVIMDPGKGKGSGIREAIAQAHGDILVFIDADGSHDPEDIPRLLKPIQEGKADIVVGSRMLGGSDELHSSLGEAIRLFGSTIINLIISYSLGVRLTDAQNGFRAIRKDVARDLGLKENVTTIEQEMVIKALKKGYRLAEVPTHEYRRRYGASSINVRRTWFRYIYSCLKYILTAE
jgi:dolichol-phosphate mannosyltransferase